MDIGSRIKSVRKALGLNQTEFGNKLAVSQSTIAGYEVGCRLPPDAILRLICVTYNVDYKWLRDGEGSQYLQQDGLDCAQEARDLLQGKIPFRVAVMSALAAMPDDWWAMLERQLRDAMRGTK